jgi:hypothetical protein
VHLGTRLRRKVSRRRARPVDHQFSQESRRRSDAFAARAEYMDETRAHMAKIYEMYENPSARQQRARLRRS